MLLNFFLNQFYTSMRGGGQRSLNAILENIYPIGSVHLTIGDYDPSEYFGGVWEKVSGGFLYGCVNSISDNIINTPEDKTYNTTLTISQIPAHNHMIVVNKAGADIGTSLYGADFIQTPLKWGDGNMIRPTGGGQGHSHDIPHIGVWIWKRIS